MEEKRRNQQVEQDRNRNYHYEYLVGLHELIKAESIMERYQPRFCSRSASAIVSIARPFIAPIRSALTSSKTLGSSKWVVAFTIARARASAISGLANSLELSIKMPEPTNTASAPSCRTNDASAGVAIPPAEKLGTGSLPVLATMRT